jgi:hypothetical protein
MAQTDCRVCLFGPWLPPRRTSCNNSETPVFPTISMCWAASETGSRFEAISQSLHVERVVNRHVDGNKTLRRVADHRPSQSAHCSDQPRFPHWNWGSGDAVRVADGVVARNCRAHRYGRELRDDGHASQCRARPNETKNRASVRSWDAFVRRPFRPRQPLLHPSSPGGSCLIGRALSPRLPGCRSSPISNPLQLRDQRSRRRT